MLDAGPQATTALRSGARLCVALPPTLRLVNRWGTALNGPEKSRMQSGPRWVPVHSAWSIAGFGTAPLGPELLPSVTAPAITALTEAQRLDTPEGAESALALLPHWTHSPYQAPRAVGNGMGVAFLRAALQILAQDNDMIEHRLRRVSSFPRRAITSLGHDL